MQMQKTKTEHALALFKAGISAVPVVGGPIASLVDDYVPTATQRSIKRVIQILTDRLGVLESRISLETLNKDEFAELFKTCYLVIVRTQQEVKLRAVTNILTSILLKDGDSEKLSYTELDHYVRCIDSLSIGAIEVLGQCLVLAKAKKAAVVGVEDVRIDFGPIQDQIPTMTLDLLMGLIGELNSFNLVHLTGAPSVRDRGYRNYEVYLTPLGAKFVTQILGA